MCTSDNIHSLPYRQKYDRSLSDDIERTGLIFLTMVFDHQFKVITFLLRYFKFDKKVTIL